MPLLVNPINSNPALDAEHAVYLGGTGSGKTSAVKHIGLVPKKAQTLFFDPYRNYAGSKFHAQMCHGFSDPAQFIKAAVQGRRMGCAFKLAYIPPKGACMSELELFSTIAWALGDGFKPKLHVVIEELASCAETSGKLEGKTGELLRGGRQFGHVVHTIFQRGQEVPKTVTNQSSIWWLGAVNSGVDADWVAKQKGIHSNEIADLKSAKVNKQRIGKAIAEYLIVRDGIGNLERGALNCETGKTLSRNYR